MTTLIKFHEMEPGKTYETAVMVTGMSDSVAKNGNPYVRLELFDGLKSICSNVFDYTVADMNKYNIHEESVLHVILTLKPGNGTVFYNLEYWTENTDPDVSKADFAHVAPINADEAFNWLVSIVKSVDSDPEKTGSFKSLSELTLKLLQDNAEAFKKSSAAVMMHHNFLAGLLYHTVRMTCLAFKTCETYSMLDKELLVCGTVLHDIGKITCLDTSDLGTSEVSVQGRLLDHAVAGIIMIHDEARKDLYDPEKIQMLEHMLASHHGKKEWDAITTPAFPEAEALHIIDLMDSRMNMFEEAYIGQESGTVSKAKVYGLENSYIYKPLYPEG